MPIAFVLINTDVGSESEVLKTLRKSESVEEASMVYGVYDILAKVRANTISKLKETVTLNVRKLEKVNSTITMIVVEQQE